MGMVFFVFFPGDFRENLKSTHFFGRNDSVIIVSTKFMRSTWGIRVDLMSVEAGSEIRSYLTTTFPRLPKP